MRNAADFKNFTGFDSLFKEKGLPAPSSAYIINVLNTFALNVPNLVLFGANTNLYGAGVGSGFFLNGVYNYSTVQITSGLGIYNYYQTLLAQSQTQPFVIGTTVIVAVSVNAQLNQSIQLSTTDANGKTIGVPITLLKDPYQKQRDMIVIETPYAIDGSTSLTIQNVLPSAEFNVFFFPSDNVNPVNALSGENTTGKYAKPEILRVHPVPSAIK